MKITYENSQILKSSNYSFIPLADLFEYLFMFLLCRHLPGQAGPKIKTVCQGYERIIWEVFRRSGYFSTYGITVSMSCIWNIYNTSWLSIIMKQFHYYYLDIYKWTINQNIQLKAKMFPQKFFSPLQKWCLQAKRACMYNTIQ